MRSAAAADGVSPAPDAGGVVSSATGSSDVVMTDPARPGEGLQSHPAPSTAPTGPGADVRARTDETSGVERSQVAIIGAVTMFELAVCKDGYDRSFDPAWNPNPKKLSTLR